MHPPDEPFMRRALALAERGRGHVSPNPVVGCVVVSRGEIVGEGWHARYGGPHAEVNALSAVADPARLSDATVYVTLEPCSHHGKTPPCADLLVDKGVRRVVVATTDSNPQVGGRGLARLRAAGIETDVGLLAEAARWQNRRFFTGMERGRPYVILKWAQTADGLLARADGTSKWISNALSRRWVHRWRAEEDAILVGKNTALTDNPRLNVRLWHGPDPTRVVLDRHLTLPDYLHLFDGSQPTLRYNLSRDEQREGQTLVRLPDGPEFLPALLADLHQRGLQSVLVEGGTGVLNAFLETGLYDEIRQFVGAVRFGEGLPAPTVAHRPDKRLTLRDDELNLYYLSDGRN